MPRHAGQSDPDQLDTMYSWGDLYAYGREAVLADVSFSRDTVEQINAEAGLSQQTKLNVEHNFLPFVEQHPDTQFIFFFPPYSAAHWYQFYTQGQMEYHLQQKKALAEALLPYGNVEIYDFQARTEWICDLNQYIDAKHYGPDINDAMAEEMAAGLSRVTDAAQLEANNDVIRALAAQIVEAGDWPF